MEVASPFMNDQPEIFMGQSEPLADQLPEINMLEFDRLNEVDLEALIVSQISEFNRLREELQRACTTDELQLFLIENESDIVEERNDDLLDRCTDFLTFGALKKCGKCNDGDMIFAVNGYKCNCGNFETKPERFKCTIPDDLKRKKFFKCYESQVQHRAVRSKIVARKTSIAPSGESKIDDRAMEECAVDPLSNLETTTHVYCRKRSTMSFILGINDIKNNAINYIKMQILETDFREKTIYVFSSRGTIGNDECESKVEKYDDPEKACEEFERIYYEYTSNEWQLRGNFRRIPGMWYPIYASKLPPSVEALMKLFFNINVMKNALKKLQVNVEKFSLGNLSHDQLNSASSILDNLQTAVDSEGSEPEVFSRLSKEFYDLIPHPNVLTPPPVVKTSDDINFKRHMINSLHDILRAYSMMAVGNTLKDLNCFDAYYKQLNATIEPLDELSEEYGIIDAYVTNTQVHATKITIESAFRVTRHAEQITEFSNLHNRKLLWHGSALENFASIVANGLKILAPVHGSMFGRGIYFADMISKSANYCGSYGLQRKGTMAVLLLCEVTLGNMYELQAFNSVSELPDGMHSVKGVGVSVPNPEGVKILENGTIVPAGKPIASGKEYTGSSRTPGSGPTTSLLYNEYIVYNEAQVSMKYLVKVKFS